MGCWYSRVEREELVSRCRARKNYIKQLVKARDAFSASHSLYLRSLRNTGSALLQFATAEINLCHLPPPPPPPLPPLSPTPTSGTWTTASTTTSSVIRPPPPPPSPPHASGWDFWDPFLPGSVNEEDWDGTTVASEVAVTAANVAAPPSVVTHFSKDESTAATGDLAVVVSSKGKDLLEVIKELDDYFLKAADAGGQVSLLLEVPGGTFSDQRPSGRSLGPKFWAFGSSPKWNGFGRCCDDSMANGMSGGGGGGEATTSHCSTVERLCAWEKKLYLEVRNAEALKLEHEKKVSQLRRLEMRRADYVKTEKAKKEVEKLESQIMVASQAIETTSAEIVKLRESELYPQLVNLVKGLMQMWRSMYESHQVQTHIVEQLKYFSTTAHSSDPTSEIHRQSTLQLELQVQQWHHSFCSLVKSQRDYIQSLTGWLRLSMFQLSNKLMQQKTSSQDSLVYSFCEEWHLAVNNAPDKVASEGIKSFLSVVNAVVVQQTEELRQKKRSESAFRELEKKANELRSMESKYGPSEASRRSKDPVGARRVKVEVLRGRAEDEKAKYDKAVSVTRSMTLNNLQMGLPHVFQAVTGFASVCTHAFESVYNQVAKSSNDMKRISL